ncbi:MAG TPA: IS701 family transposase [Streptosporangiaceae bacterium]|nr:IS701 family transposase [Streptosporangiaceae bacterium]
MGCLAGCFARVEPRRQARKYVTGLIGDLPRKNCWALAEQAGDATLDKMQRLLERAAWDAFEAIRAVRDFAVARLGDRADAVLVIDESGQEKAGEHTAGVKRQYLGCAGRVANGINVVYATYAAPAGHAVIAARLYVPADWAGDRDRRRAAGIPGELTFATKPALAAEIIEDLLAGGRCPPWVTGDEVYGRDAKLRSFLEDQGTGYVVKIPCSFRVTLPTGQKIRADHAARLVPAAAWQTASAGHGSKGERDYRWAWLATASAHHHLLIRRSLTNPSDLAYFYCHVPAGQACSFTTLIRVAGRRWPIEEDFALGKSWFGLADSQVRRYTALHRHLALAMAALAACAITAALARHRTSTLARPPASPDDPPPDDPGLIPLTAAEIKRVFNLVTRTWQTIRHYLHWSWWRRRHQARSAWYHQRARLRRRGASP